MSTRVWVLSLISAVSLTACNPSRYYTDGAALEQDPCPLVEVENDNWSRVTIHTIDGYLVGRVNGHTSKDFTVCPLAQHRPIFKVRAIANAFNITLDAGGPAVSDGGYVKIYIGPTPNLSYAIGQ